MQIYICQHNYCIERRSPGKLVPFFKDYNKFFAPRLYETMYVLSMEGISYNEQES